MEVGCGVRWRWIGAGGAVGGEGAGSQAAPRRVRARVGRRRAPGPRPLRVDDEEDRRPAACERLMHAGSGQNPVDIFRDPRIEGRRPEQPRVHPQHERDDRRKEPQDRPGGG